MLTTRLSMLKIPNAGMPISGHTGYNLRSIIHPVTIPPVRFSLSGSGEGEGGHGEESGSLESLGPEPPTPISWPPETGAKRDARRARQEEDKFPPRSVGNSPHWQLGSLSPHSATRSRSHQRLTGPISVNSRSFCLEICLSSLALLELISASPYQPSPGGKPGLFAEKERDGRPPQPVHPPPWVPILEATYESPPPRL